MTTETKDWNTADRSVPENYIAAWNNPIHSDEEDGLRSFQK